MPAVAAWKNLHRYQAFTVRIIIDQKPNQWAHLLTPLMKGTNGLFRNIGMFHSQDNTTEQNKFI
jgi:hypothetical protein